VNQSRVVSIASLVVLIALTGYMVNCVGITGSPSDPGGSPPPAPPPSPSDTFTGVLMWKGDVSGQGLYASEKTLTPANVNSSKFGKWGSFTADGLIVAQPLYIDSVTLADGSTHRMVIAVTEHDSVYAFDADHPGAGSLWERHYVDPANGITPLPDNFGGRSNFDGEVGITGTPYVDTKTGALYFVTVLVDKGAPEQWLRALDVRTGKDYGAGSMKIAASVPGDGKGSENGQIAFDPSLQNQRAGLRSVNGDIVVAWGSFSDWGVYHGWLMAFDPSTLRLKAVFNPSPQYQANDPANGPADHGGGAAFWQGGAAPAIDADGNIYINAADGSFDANNTGGNNYGDTMLKLKYDGSSFQIVDWFTPFNQACVDVADLELGSGGVVLLPTDITEGIKLAVSYNKEGRLFVVNTDTMGNFNTNSDQIPQEFMVGAKSCTDGMGNGEAEGPDWNRLYGDPSYWNGYLYAGPSNMEMKQYKFENGLLNPTPVAWTGTATGLRGANSVVSANGTQNGILWAYEKSASGQGILHAYDATLISKELWNSNVNSNRDVLGEGVGFCAPVVASGHVIVSSDHMVTIYGALQ